MLIMSILFTGPGLLIPIDGSMMRPCREKNREGISRVDSGTVQRLPGTRLQPGQNRQVSQESLSRGTGICGWDGRPINECRYFQFRRAVLEILEFAVKLTMINAKSIVLKARREC